MHSIPEATCVAVLVRRRPHRFATWADFLSDHGVSDLDVITHEEGDFIYLPCGSKAEMAALAFKLPCEFRDRAEIGCLVVKRADLDVAGVPAGWEARAFEFLAISPTGDFDVENALAKLPVIAHRSVTMPLDEYAAPSFDDFEWTAGLTDCR